MKRTDKTKRMVESALMISIATILGMFSIVEMPYGGSVTLASMLPIVLISYRHGVAWGLGAGSTYAVLQQLLGLKNLGYFTTWQSIVAIILLDYLLAFTLVGLGGVFRRSVKRQNLSLALGGLLACLLRYLCHVISGATVWAGLSIPTEAALGYSIGYNATYMIPEAVVLVLAAYALGSLLDFRREQPTRLPSALGNGRADLLGVVAGLLIFAATAIDVSLIFSHMQNPDTGAFDITCLVATPFAESFWLKVVIITGVAVVSAVALLILRRRSLAKSGEA